MNDESVQVTADSSDSGLQNSSHEANRSSFRLSQTEVLMRLYAPSSNLPTPHPDKAVIVVTAGETERAVSYAQIENLIAHSRGQLEEHGVKEGDTVIFYCENCPEYTSTILACWSLNAMVALVDYRAEREAVLAMTKELGAAVIVTAKKMYLDFALESKLFTGAGIKLLDVTPFADSKDLKPNSSIDVAAIDLDRPAFAILTSGTTGKPKTSVHTLRSLSINIIDLLDTANEQGSLTALTPLPISHIFGLTVFLLAQTLGAKTVLTQLEPVGFVKAVHRHKPEWIAALPQFYGALLSAPKGFINLKNSRLLLCGGAPPTVSLCNKFEETFGKQLNNGFGSTECKLVAFNMDKGPPLSVGRPIKRVSIDIVNESDEVQPEGTVGEVRIGGPMLMNGYLNNPKESSKVLRNGYYYTGDIGRFENGYLYIVGRKSDFVTVAGVLVEAGEIEEVLRNHPEVKDVAVTAVPNKRLGQIVKASIVLVDEDRAESLKALDPKDVRETKLRLQKEFKSFCKQKLTRFQIPMRWNFFGPHESLPKTLAGKTDKKKMVAEDNASA